MLCAAGCRLPSFTILYAKCYSVGVRWCRIYTHSERIQGFRDTGTSRLPCSHRHKDRYSQTAEWHWCGGLCQLHANPVFCSPPESCSYSFSTSLCLFLSHPSLSLSPLLLSPHHHRCHPPVRHTHLHTHIHSDVNTSTSQNTEGCVYFRHASPECMDSCLSPLPPLCLSLLLSSCSLPSPQRLSSCWSCLRCSGKSIVCVWVCSWGCVFSYKQMLASTAVRILLCAALLLSPCP